MNAQPTFLNIDYYLENENGLRKKCPKPLIDLVNWNGDVWENPEEAGDTEPLNSDESSFSVEAASSPSMV